MSHVNNRYEGKQKDKEKFENIIKERDTYRKWWKRYSCVYGIHYLRGTPKYFNGRNFAKGKAFAKKRDHKKVRHTEDLPLNQVGKYQEVSQYQNEFMEY